MLRRRLFLLILITVAGNACNKERSLNQTTNPTSLTGLNLPENPFNYDALSNPNLYGDAFTQAQDNEPDSNRVSNWGATLGRVLFYDKTLSKNYAISCASCHIQSEGFSDTAKFSVGFEGEITKRHSMSLINARYYASGKFFWDERAQSLEEQVLMPIQDEIEMGLNLDTLLARVSLKAYYPPLFNKAFGTEEITTDKISYALAQFVRSIVAVNTKYHRAKGLRNPQEYFPGFTAMENLGKDIFFGSKTINCSGCHITNAFVSGNPRNNGVRNGDLGLFAHDRPEQYIGAFKNTSLVDIANRAPYMHDGSMESLEEVIGHYSFRLNNFDGHLDPHLLDGDGQPMRMNLDSNETAALIAFLNTLSDDNIRSNKAYSDPFLD